MHIESDTKLDYSDVLLRPKRSTLTSRKEVKLTRTFAFPHSKRKIDVNPIIAANMDGVGTFEMLKVLAEDNMLVALNKSYTPEELRDVYNHAAMNDSSRMKESLCLTIGMQVQTTRRSESSKVNSQSFVLIHPTAIWRNMSSL